MTLNKLGIVLSPSSKLRLLDECGKVNKELVEQKIKSCFLCSFVGDNCDIRIQPKHMSSDHQVKDCHYFALLLIFSRINSAIRQGLSQKTPSITPTDIDPKSFIPNAAEQEILLASYKVLLGRFMVKNFPEFAWMDSVLPKHISHPYEHITSAKTSVATLDVLLKNEAKYEDCVQILDECERIAQDHYTNALGRLSL